MKYLRVKICSKNDTDEEEKKWGEYKKKEGIYIKKDMVLKNDTSNYTSENKNE